MKPSATSKSTWPPCTPQTGSASKLNAAGVIRTIGNNIYYNTNAFVIQPGGQIVSDGQNRMGGNANTGAPNASIALQ